MFVLIKNAECAPVRDNDERKRELQRHWLKTKPASNKQHSTHTHTDKKKINAGETSQEIASKVEETMDIQEENNRYYNDYYISKLFLLTNFITNKDERYT